MMSKPTRTALVAIAGFAAGVAALHVTTTVVEPVIFAALYSLLDKLGVPDAAVVGQHRWGGGRFRLDATMPVVPLWAYIVDGWLWLFVRGAVAGAAVLLMLRGADFLVDKACRVAEPVCRFRIQYANQFRTFVVIAAASGVVLMLSHAFFYGVVSRYITMYVFLEWPIDYVAPLIVIVAMALLTARRHVDADTPECDRCGYSLVGLRSGRCPECGSSVHEQLRWCVDPPSALLGVEQ